MANQLKVTLSQFWHTVQQGLFPWLEEELSALGEKHRQIITTLEMIRIEEYVQSSLRVGRPSACRAAIARAFVAKAILNLPTTDMLLDRLAVDITLRRICGWERLKSIPHKSTFSRAFAEFSSMGLCDRVHEAVIRRYQSDRLVGHLSRDSTMIEAREKALCKPKVKQAPKARGRPKKGEVRPPKTETRLERQFKMTSLEQMVAELPKQCDVGTKLDAKGYKKSWRGYKLHIDTMDGDIPVSCLITSASVHDSQVAIPLATMSSKRVTNCYDLMDSAYDSGLIRVHSDSLGHVPIIDINRRGPKDNRVLHPHEKQRYKKRSAAERVNSRLKDSFGALYVRVKGWEKVMTHLMFAVLALTADQLLRLAT